ncbi:MAG: hypothetical protein LBQ02_02925 [Candidatus Nomurabacteria bacterium]|nr:hypothetical protein [Candidatus Nomurabacteria bacterium]
MDNKTNTYRYKTERNKKSDSSKLRKRGLVLLLAAGLTVGAVAHNASADKLTPEEQLTEWEQEYDGYDFRNTDSVYIAPGDTAWNTAIRETSDNLGITMDEAGDIVRFLNPSVQLGYLHPGDTLRIPRPIAKAGAE